ncbi:hypothetical protein GNZ12_07955 [Paraburkholderia sp. 1N]|uniref:Uncharacterized protein n=1 Tax=Paraburkholderia solitsugae TaxID=2675748 RepID=A0ABX2BM91_9BURK|nr:hypothetical protein [Paraburkholderia solitsugae]NPT41251.1 hypothetical protein [Paraburkholderia solitsugae]
MTNKRCNSSDEPFTELDGLDPRKFTDDILDESPEPTDDEVFEGIYQSGLGLRDGQPCLPGLARVAHEEPPRRSCHVSNAGIGGKGRWTLQSIARCHDAILTGSLIRMHVCAVASDASIGA